MPSTAEHSISAGENLNFEKVWAMFQEVAERQKETDRQMKETDRKMKETDRQISKLGGRFGEMVEHLVAPHLMEKFNERGFNFTRCSQNCKIREPGNPNPVAEIDALLEDGGISVAVEVKAKPNQSDVDDHIKRLEKLSRAASGRHKYQGAIAGAIMSDEVRGYILKRGLYVIEQTGDTVQITVPEGFKPQEW
jgi:hypothetical protein